MRTAAHPGDDLLLLAMDGALARRRQERVETHLATCDACQGRLQRLESTLADATHSYRSSEDGSGHRSADARLRLEQALRRAGDQWERSLWTRLRAVVVPTDMLTMAAAASFVAFLVAWIAGAGGPSWSPGALTPAGGFLPVASLTPGAVSNLTADQLCAGTRSSRLVTDDVRRRVLVDYGMEGTPADTYELDALVTPELGGTTAPENLWPQRYGSPVWNAHVKDALELLFAEKVCADDMALAQAQRELATDWVAAYKRHFRTDVPIPAHARATSADDDLEYESPRLVQSMARLVVNVRLSRQ
jgi:hypothetical protein